MRSAFLQTIKVIGIIIITLCLKVDAQRYPFTTITNKDGLPQSSVFKVVQDKQGYIWMATEAGICRYDGYQFKTYSYFTGLDGNFIFDVEFDRKGRLWVGSFGTGIAVFNGTNFYSFNSSNGFPVNFVSDMYFSSSGDLWVAGKDEGILRVSIDYRPKIHRYPLTKGLYGQQVDELPNGDILGVGEGGLFRFVKSKNYEPELIKEGYYSGLLVDKKGNTWFGGNNVLFVADEKGIVDRSSWLKGKSVRNIGQTSLDDKIYLSLETGLIVIEDTTTKFINSSNGLSYDLVNNVISDGFGNIWVSTYGNGATLLNDKGMLHYDSDHEGGDLCAFSIGEEKNGTIWIGKYFGGYYEITDSSFKKTDQNIPPDANPLTACTDSGKVYLNANNTTIYKIEGGEVVWQFRNPFPEEAVYGVLKTKEGKLLSCGSFGAILIDERTNQYELIPCTKNIFLKEPFYDEYGNLWLIGELGEVYSLRNNQLLDFTKELNSTMASVTHGMYDPIRHVWWFTRANGVVVWDGKNKLELNSGNILKSDLSFSVALDKNGNVWIGQVQGIEFINMQKKTITHIGYDQGFTPVETNAGAIYTDSKGNVWFGTLTSATRVNVDAIGKDSTRGRLRLQEIEVNGKPYYIESYNDTADPKLSLRYYQNNLDFQFASLCYTNAKDVQYSWKMEGVDNNWITKINTREVNYANLKPGDYTFMVKAQNPNGYVTNQVNIEITIAKPFWNTAGFYLFEALVFLFIVFLSFRFTRQASNNRLGQIMTLLTIFIIFESGMLYISGYIDKFTSGIPVFQLVMNVLLAASLHPLEQRIQRFMKKWARKKKK